MATARGKKFIQSALHPKAKGSLRRAAGLKKGQTMTVAKARSMAKGNSKTAQRARFYVNVLSKTKK